MRCFDKFSFYTSLSSLYCVPHSSVLSFTFHNVLYRSGLLTFFQSGSISIASYAIAGIATAEMSVHLSVTFWYCIKMNKGSVMISSTKKIRKTRSLSNAMHCTGQNVRKAQPLLRDRATRKPASF